MSIEFAFAPLLRGEWHATEVRLAGAAARLGLDAGGRLNWQADLSGMQPSALSVERLVIEDGEAVLTDAASGGRLDLTRVWFIGDVKSLLGPVRGEGGFVVDDARYGYRLALARRSEVTVEVCSTGQHREMLAPVEAALGVTWVVAEPVARRVDSEHAQAERRPPLVRAAPAAPDAAWSPSSSPAGCGRSTA